MNILGVVRRFGKSVWLTIGLGVLATCATGLALHSLCEDTIEQAGREQTGLAIIFGREITEANENIEAVLDDVESLIKADSPTDVRDMRQFFGGEDFSQHLRARALSERRIEVISIVDESGDIVSSSRGWPAPNANLAHSDHFRYLSEHEVRSTFVSVPERSRVTGDIMVFFGRRISSPDGKFLGCVHVGVNMKFFVSVSDGIPALHDKGLLIAKRDGSVLFRYPPVPDSMAARIPEDSPWNGLVAKGGGEYISPGYFDGVRRLIAVQPLSDGRMVVNVAQSLDAILASFNKRALQIGFGAFFALGCAALLARGQFLEVAALARSAALLQAKSQDLTRVNQRFASVLDNMPQGVGMFNADRRLIVANRRFGEMYDLDADEVAPGALLDQILARRVAKGIFVGDGEAYIQERISDVKSRTPRQWIDRLSNGRVVSIARRPMEDGGWLTVHEDVTARQIDEDKIEKLALYDPLTDVANRALLLRELRRRLETPGENDRLAVLLLDLDDFKIVNDTHGHPFGDALLRAVALRLSAAVGERGLVARMGGDEFAIVVGDADERSDAATGLAFDLLERIRSPFEIDGFVLTIKPSIGLARAPRDGSDADSLLKSADLALYAAKTEGRDRIREFEPKLERGIRDQLALQAELAEAIERGQFEVHYQPIVDARSGETREVEALVRWRHPERGMIRPDYFIQLAERTGQIQAIGAFVLREACQAATRFPDRVGVSVNLSPAQFGRGNLVALVTDVLAQTGLAASRLTLEVTETALMENIEASRGVLAAIRELGVKIALDDFGTGYSSLSYLQSFVLDKIKIDRSFVKEMETNPRTQTIVALIASISGSLSAMTIAEGVETKAQLDLIVAAGCDRAQGYYFSRPTPAEALNFVAKPKKPREAA